MLFIQTPNVVSTDFSVVNVLESPFPEFNSQFGYQIDAYSGKVLIADYRENAYIYDEELTVLPVPVDDKKFESTIDINEEYIAVGYVSTYYDGLDGAGIVYLFESDGRYLETIFPPEPITAGHFGASVLLGNDFLYVGEAWADNIELDEGKVHRYTYDGDFIDSMIAPESSYAATFGARLNGNEEWLVVSELNGVHGMLNNGEVHLYSWEGELKLNLTPSNSLVLNDFGASVAVSETLIIVGESISKVDDHQRSGRVYIFDVSGKLLEVITSPMPIDGGLFGFSVALNEEYIAVGEPRANGLHPIEGNVHLFNLKGEFLETLNSPVPESNSEFGMSVTFDEGDLYVGQPSSTVDTQSKAGRVIQFTEKKTGDPSLYIALGLILVLISTVLVSIIRKLS